MVYKVITFNELENNSSIIGVHGVYCDSKNVRIGRTIRVVIFSSWQ